MDTPSMKPNGGDPHDIRVLVVDNSEMLCQALADLMQLLPGLCCVGTAKTAQEGAELTRAHCPDAVLINSRLPDMSGPRAVQLIRAIYPAVRIIGYSAQPGDGVKQALLRAGADAFVDKAEGVDELISTIRRLGLVAEPARSECDERARPVA